MADLFTFVEQMRTQGHFDQIVRDPESQFGPPERPYLGAELLPEQMVESNAYREDRVLFRTGVIANAGERYSPVQMKDTGEMIASFLVELAESDIGSEFTSRRYDALVRLLNQASTFEAQSQLIRFVDNEINDPLLQFNEKMRWDAIVNASLTIVGDNLSETITLANPSGHRANAGGTWSNNAYDPYTDMLAVKDAFAADGYNIENGRIIASQNVQSILLKNSNLKTRIFGGSSRVLGTDLVLGAASAQGLNDVLQADGFPAIERYDRQYRTQSGTGRYIPNNVMIFIAPTGIDQEIDLGDAERFIPDTLGYTAIGRTTGQSSPGRTTNVEAFKNKPPRIDGEGWQTSFPVVLDPLAIRTIQAIA